MTKARIDIRIVATKHYTNKSNYTTTIKAKLASYDHERTRHNSTQTDTLLQVKTGKTFLLSAVYTLTHTHIPHTIHKTLTIPTHIHQYMQAYVPIHLHICTRRKHIHIRIYTDTDRLLKSVTSKMLSEILYWYSHDVFRGALNRYHWDLWKQISRSTATRHRTNKIV